MIFRRPQRDWRTDPPAGVGKPALPISGLHPVAWHALSARASALPLEHVHDHYDCMALCSEEFRAAFRIGRRLNLDDDQCHLPVGWDHPVASSMGPPWALTGRP